MESEYYRQFAGFTEEQFDSLRGYQYTGPGQTSDRPYRLTTCNLTKNVIGWHPYWAGTAYNSYDYSVLSQVIYFSYEVDPATGSYITIHNWKTTNLVNVAKANGTKVLLCATLFGGTNLSTFLSNATARQRCIDSLIALVQYRNADGVNIDFEGLPASQRANFVTFITALANQMHTAIPGSHVSIALPAVDWSNSFDIPALNAVVDELIIMGYDYYWSGSSNAGPTGLLYYGTLFYSQCNSKSINTYIAKGATPSKLHLAVPYYAYRYPTVDNTLAASTTGSGISRTYAAAKAESQTYGYNWEPQSASAYYMYNSGGQWYQCYWHDSLSLSYMYDVVLMRGLGGIGIWALSYDGNHPELWTLLHEKFTDCAQVACTGTLTDMGGAYGTYFNNENWTYTLQPTGASQVTLQFTSFSLENGYDSLWIYDGPSTSSPLIGAYTGTNSPGTIVSSGPSLTLRFVSDGATVSSGWIANWSCIIAPPDNIPPQTTILPHDWHADDFPLSFSDSDNSGTIRYRFWRIDYLDTLSLRWTSNRNRGFFYSADGNLANWTSQVGTWSTTPSGEIYQSDETASNTNLWIPVVQTDTLAYLYHWKMRIGGSGTNRRAGIHFFCDSAQKTNRGNSYFVFYRVDNDKVQLYKVVNDVWSLVSEVSYPINPNQWYDCKVIFDPPSGKIAVYLDNQFLFEWTDPSPHTVGNAISLRTGNCLAWYDTIAVYRSRGTTETVTVRGPNSEVPVDVSLTHGWTSRVTSIVVDGAKNLSSPTTQFLKVDWTVPIAAYHTVAPWYTKDSSLNVSTVDNSGVRYLFWQLRSLTSSGWKTEPTQPYFYDDFLSLSGWQVATGTWILNNDTLIQTDETNSNTNIWIAVRQPDSAAYLYHWKMKTWGSGSNRRAGMHFFCDSAQKTNRGNSYFVFYRVDNDKVQLYKVVNDVWSLVHEVAYPINPNQWYDCKVIFAPNTGQIFVFIDDSLLFQWTDPSPHTVGNGISLRTGNCQTAYHWVSMYQSTPLITQGLITTGPGKGLFTQNPSVSTPAGMVATVVVDSAVNLMHLNSLLNVDWTPPDPLTFVYDGRNGMDTDLWVDGDSISALWSGTRDPHSNLKGYWYCIGTSPGSCDVVSITWNGTDTSMVRSGLTLVNNQWYYVTVWAENNAGLLSQQSSDGAMYQLPLGIAMISLTGRRTGNTDLLEWSPLSVAPIAYSVYQITETSRSLIATLPGNETRYENRLAFPFGITRYQVCGQEKQGETYCSNLLVLGAGNAQSCTGTYRDGTIQVQCLNSNGVVHLMDALGRSVAKVPLTDGKAFIPLRNLSSEVYILHVLTEDGMEWSQRILVKP
jgi:spore germination protein YaaH